MNFPGIPLMDEQIEQQEGLRAFSVSVRSNIEVQGLTPYLRYAGMNSGLKLDLSYGTSNQLATGNCSAGEELIPADMQAVLVWFWLPAYSPVLTDQFAQHGAEKISWEVERVKYTCVAMIKAIRKATSAPVLWLGFEPVSYPAYGIADGGIGQRAVIHGLNAFIAGELQSAGNGWFIDTSVCLERVGEKSFYDWQCKMVRRAPIATDGLASVAAEVAKYIRALSGRVKKCLVLDCDNTLWGGIVGEDGVDGIQLGLTDSGGVYRDFQAHLLNLYHRGVLLAICSKNNEEDVLEVFRHRSDLVLKEEHFALIKANWNDKVSNIRAIASQLNIGLDSMVFVDDSPFEIECVHMALPEVAVLHVAADSAGGHARQLMECGLFDALTVTAEDKRRGELYRAEAKRNEFIDARTEVEEYFGRHFEIKMEVFTPEGPDLERAAQLCQRTNQFNLTTTRYTHDDLEQMIAADYVVKALRVSDRFGDCGMVGLAIVKCTEDTAEIVNFLLSCRALSRGIEAAFLKEILAELPCQRIVGCYVPTKKNIQTATFYTKNGFVPWRQDHAAERFVLNRHAAEDESADVTDTDGSR